ncbi:hypothetical protein VTJ83DRAFT_3239 [Remersonia thermophila]|uniref:Nucleolar protein 9 n=1 Tax=Remersonia thermophila TaxID=72144 RepID=A0ABR4DDG5_9PEZI
MAKVRKSKREKIRDEKRARKRGRELADQEERSSKRQRHADDKTDPDNNELFTLDPHGDETLNDDSYGQHDAAGQFQREFFGMLDDKEQEYFRHADEMLELNDFPTPEARTLFLSSVYREAHGKELKLASSQSCSRLMERLILLSTTRQKKRLFAAFAGHFMSLITHRFASHCCEKLFLMSAPVVTAELSGKAEEPDSEDDEDVDENMRETINASMEDIFLLTLDELETHLSFLLSHRYGSHALRVLLVVLSGRPLNQAGTKSLLQGKGKEYITVEGASIGAALGSEPRVVPNSFSMAIAKIISDSTANLDPTALRVLAKHPTGNPTLQLLLELEITTSAQAKPTKQTKKKAKSEADEAEEEPAASGPSLLERLVPDAPASFADEKSAACEFVNSMLYDPVGSRLLETLITHCPGKIFRGLQTKIFVPRIQSLLRNDIASYPAIRVLNRLGKVDLSTAVEQSLPEIGTFVEKGRLNVIKAFFERCHVRHATDELASLLQALTKACGGNWKHIVPKLCLLNEPAKESKPDGFQPPDSKNKSALVTHGSQVVTTMLEIPGATSKAIQQSLLSLTTDQLVHLATSSGPTAAILTSALAVPAQIPHFHKLLVAALLPKFFEVAGSQHGSAIVNAIISVPSHATTNKKNKEEANGTPAVVPFYLKENAMSLLDQHEKELRTTWLGRNVWHTWRGDYWKYRRHDWVRWAKEVDPEDARVAAMPKPKAEEEKEKGKSVGKGSGKPAGKAKGKSGEDEKSLKGKADDGEGKAKKKAKGVKKGEAKGQEKEAKDAEPKAEANGQEETEDVEMKDAPNGEGTSNEAAHGEDGKEEKKKKKKKQKKEKAGEEATA